MQKSPLFVIFTTVLVDLIGFGMVIPLISIYGRHFGASGWSLALLGATYSLMQFLFSPYWGNLSDRIGRRPVLLISLAGSTLSYIVFGLADSVWLLIGSRMVGGIFAANVGAAQAYIADVTKPEERARGMGLIGAAFGIGFMLGPPMGGILVKHWGISAPGLVAATICGLNWILAYFRLKESLPLSQRIRARARTLSPINMDTLRKAWAHPLLGALVLTYFGFIFAFSNMEQTFSLLFQQRFGFTTMDAGYYTGWLLMFSSFIGAVIQGGLIKRLTLRFGEARLLTTGLAIYGVTLAFFGFGPTFGSFFALMALLSLSSALINPSLSSLLSKSTPGNEQGAMLGLNQSFGSLARALGPFWGLYAFQVHVLIPYLSGAVITLALWIMIKKRLAFFLRSPRSRA
jgi:DHA1 family tetracycline resistance protein-like MFS transporter